MSSAEADQNYWFIFRNQQLLLYINEEEKLLPSRPLLQANFTRSFPLGNFNNIFCYCAETTTVELPPNMEFFPLRRAFEKLGKSWYIAAAKAVSVLMWDHNHQYCGRCGIPTYHRAGTYERICPSCKLVVYPRISPSIIVLIQRGDEILMARSPHFSPGTYGLIAGYVEAGESLEDTVHREVFEETSLKIKNLHYFDSQAWPFPDSLMVGFTADYDAGELSIDHSEIEAAGWYHFDRLPSRPGSKISIASRLIDHFIAKQKINLI